MGEGALKLNRIETDLCVDNDIIIEEKCIS